MGTLAMTDKPHVIRGNACRYSILVPSLNPSKYSLSKLADAGDKSGAANLLKTVYRYKLMPPPAPPSPETFFRMHTNCHDVFFSFNEPKGDAIQGFPQEIIQVLG